ncbi:MAG: amidohydrolase family protein [Candidatus Korobacteraceae bacterium]
MRRFLIWLGRLALGLVSLVVIGVLANLVAHTMQVRRLKHLAGVPPSAYIVEQSPVIVLDHVRVIDGTGRPPLEDQCVVIESGNITYVGPSAGRPDLPTAKVTDLTGRTVFPGIVGMHEHLFTMASIPSRKHVLAEQSTAFPLMYLAAGVTTARTTGSIAPEKDMLIKQRIDQGEAVGPELFLTAPYLEGTPSVYPEMRSLAGAEEARGTVDLWADRGMTSFKAYMTITPDELRAAVAEAHARGLKITGHLCSIGFRQAADLGIDNLEHGLFVDTEFYSKKQPNTCPLGDTLAYLSEYNSRLDVESPPVQDTVHYLVAHHVAVTSTLAVIEEALGLPRPAEDINQAKHAMTWQGRQLSRLQGAITARLLRPDHLLQKEMEFEHDFARAGGTLLAGCDPTGHGSVLAGSGDQRELELLVEAGFTPIAAIHIATQNGAEFLGIGSRVGTISRGKQADLVVVKGDPSRNISDIRKVEIVFRNGTGYSPAKLLAGIDGVVGLDD